MKNNKAYVSGITNDSFLNGVLVMFASLNENCNSDGIDRVCFITEMVSSTAVDMLRKHGIIPYFAKQIHSFGNGRWSTTFQKICIFNMTDYEKIVWIDADMMVVGDIDGLFSCPHMSCVRSRAPLETNANRYPFNSGLMVIEPNERQYKEICVMIPIVIAEYSSKNIPVGDQNVLNEYFSNWPFENERHLPDGFNVFWGSIENYFDAGYSIYSSKKRISVVHFTGKHKPWNLYGVFVLKSFIRSIRYNKRFPSKESVEVLKRFYRYRVGLFA